MSTEPRADGSAVQQSLPGSPRASTGDARVDAVLSDLDALDTLPAEDHAAVIEGVHERLRETLAALDGDDR